MRKLTTLSLAVSLLLMPTLAAAAAPWAPTVATAEQLSLVRAEYDRLMEMLPEDMRPKTDAERGCYYAGYLQGVMLGKAAIADRARWTGSPEQRLAAAIYHEAKDWHERNCSDGGPGAPGGRALAASAYLLKLFEGAKARVGEAQAFAALAAAAEMLPRVRADLAGRMAIGGAAVGGVEGVAVAAAGLMSAGESAAAGAAVGAGVAIASAPVSWPLLLAAVARRPEVYRRLLEGGR